MDEVDEIVVPGGGSWSFLWLVGLWFVGLFYTFGSNEAPLWAFPLLLGVLPFLAVLVGWSVFTRKVIVASADGVRVTWQPFALWDAVWVPRDHLQVVSIDERVIDDEDQGWFGKPRTQWAVVAVTARRTVTLAEGYAVADSARRVAERIRRATGC